MRLFVAALLLLVGCDEEGPEQRLRSVIAAMEEAAEVRDVGDFMTHLSRDYRDEEGRDRLQVRRLASYELLRNESLFLFHMVREIELSGNRAIAVVLVAMAGQPLAGVGDLLHIEADLYRFEVEFENSDDWKVVAARWRPAQIADFS